MASTKEIKRRIKSVKNTKKITKAMELVAASKMKRAVSSTLSSRLYAEYSWQVLTSIGKNLKDITHPLFETKAENKNILLILVTSNRGLCGAYNAQVIKKCLVLLRNQKDANVDVLTIGKKGDSAMRRLGKNVVASFSELPDNITLRDVTPISKLAIGEYLSGKYDQVLVAYTDFVSPLVQKPNIKQLVPVSRESLADLIADLGENNPTMGQIVNTEYKTEYLFEGDVSALLGSLSEKLIRMQVYQMLLESNASEQSARMVAMKNASEASGEMIDDLTLVFNKARQASITQEISEISAGMASVN